MMHHFLGDQAFHKGLISFLKQYQNGNADKNDLFSVLTKEAHTANALLSNETVQLIMETWTNRAGFPVVHSIADYENNKLKIFQVCFSLVLWLKFITNSLSNIATNSYFFYFPVQLQFTPEITNEH